MLIHRNKQTPDQVVSIERKDLKYVHSTLSPVIYLLERITFSLIENLVGHLQYIV